jgi:hypothetical protein
MKKPIIIEVDGRKQTLTEWARELGVGQPTLSSRIARGMTPEQAVTKPFRRALQTKSIQDRKKMAKLMEQYR